MPKSVRALFVALEALPAPGEAGRLEAMDHLAARAVTALGRFTDRPASLIPAQRALMLLGGRPGPGDDTVFGLLDALRRVDANLGEYGGFSRLLESALEAGEVEASGRLQPGDVDHELHDLAVALHLCAERLSTLDDLSHAINTPPALAAGAMVTWLVVEEAGRRCGQDEVARIEEAQAWVAHRGASRTLRALLPFAAAVEFVDDESIEDAKNAEVDRAFAMWVLATRLGPGGGKLRGKDRPAVGRLLQSAGLWPLDVFERAREP